MTAPSTCTATPVSLPVVDVFAPTPRMKTFAMLKSLPMVMLGTISERSSRSCIWPVCRRSMPTTLRAAPTCCRASSRLCAVTMTSSSWAMAGGAASSAANVVGTATEAPGDRWLDFMEKALPVGFSASRIINPLAVRAGCRRAPRASARPGTRHGPPHPSGPGERTEGFAPVAGADDPARPAKTRRGPRRRRERTRRPAGVAAEQNDARREAESRRP